MPGQKSFRGKADSMSDDEHRRDKEAEEKSDLYSGGEDEKGNTGAPDMGEKKPPELFEVPDEDGSDG
jgi:hypothetical protein